MIKISFYKGNFQQLLKDHFALQIFITSPPLDSLLFFILVPCFSFAESSFLSLLVLTISPLCLPDFWPDRMIGGRGCVYFLILYLPLPLHVVLVLKNFKPNSGFASVRINYFDSYSKLVPTVTSIRFYAWIMLVLCVSCSFVCICVHRVYMFEFCDMNFWILDCLMRIIRC